MVFQLQRQQLSWSSHQNNWKRNLLLLGLTLTLFSSVILIARVEKLVFVHNHLPLFPMENLTLSQSTAFLENDILRHQSKYAKDSKNIAQWPPTLTVYMEPSSSYDEWYEDPKSTRSTVKRPLPQRNVHSQDLTQLSFPKVNYSSNEATNFLCNNVPSLLPIDEFGTSIVDPYLPWIHDLFLSHDGRNIHLLAQNRRKCHSGKHHITEMSFWEGQVSLFQPVALKRIRDKNLNTTNMKYNQDDIVRYRLSTHQEADTDAIETRFRCRFKLVDYTEQSVTYQGETMSTYPFNYEYINWRKNKGTMLEEGREQNLFWLSPLSFDCPIPVHLLPYSQMHRLLLDIVPVRTPVRRNDRDGFFFHRGHGGPMTFNASVWWGENHILPKAADSGRWENLPVCSILAPSDDTTESVTNNRDDFPIFPLKPIAKNESPIAPKARAKPNRLVACTWTSALHQRRGNERRIADGKPRLREWIAFHLEVGFDHLYIFDNSGANATIFRLKDEPNLDFDSGIASEKDDLSSVTKLFPPSKVTRIDWPATICNNNRPNHDDPGERSSQYAAEAACRLRYGSYTDWMASMDPDEYFVPMGNHTSWKEILDKVDRDEGRKVLKFRSTRARPLLSTLVPTYDEGAKECTREMSKSHNQCLTKSDDKTYLETYNCEYIKSPKPERFARAMKQIYRPDFVLSHFVHYSTVTTDLAAEKQHTNSNFLQDVTTNDKTERFVDDELNEGVLIHAKTTVPAETFTREKFCRQNAPEHCLVGIPCPDDLPFSDALHKKNVFHNENGEFCNCWMNRKVENYWVPRLRNALSEIKNVL